MPIEIKELHIRVAVNTSVATTPAPEEAGSAHSAEDKDAVVAECVEQVLRILQAKAER